VVVDQNYALVLSLLPHLQVTASFTLFGVRFAYFDWQHHSYGFVLSLLSGIETLVQILPYFEVRMFLCALPVHLFTRALAEANGNQSQIKEIQ